MNPPAPTPATALSDLPPPPKQLKVGFGEVLKGIEFVFVLSAAVTIWYLIDQTRNDPTINEGSLLANTAEYIRRTGGQIDLTPGWLVIFALFSAGGFGLWTWITSHRHGTGSIRNDFQFHFTRPDIKIGVLLAAGSLALSVLLTEVILPFITSDPDVGTNTMALPITDLSATMFIPFLIAAAFMAGPFEELFFRGLVLKAAMNRFATPTAIGIQAVVFGIAHHGTATGTANIATILFATTTGTVYAIVALRTGRLAAPTIGHTLNNTVALTLVWLNVGPDL